MPEESEAQAAGRGPKVITLRSGATLTELHSRSMKQEGQPGVVNFFDLMERQKRGKSDLIAKVTSLYGRRSERKSSSILISAGPGDLGQAIKHLCDLAVRSSDLRPEMWRGNETLLSHLRGLRDSVHDPSSVEVTL